jgi:hypothetical protein
MRFSWCVAVHRSPFGSLSFRFPGPVPSARRLASVCALVCLVLSGGCATPVGVERADPPIVHRELTGNVLSTGELSGFTQNALRGSGLMELAADDPKAALLRPAANS